MTYSTSPPVFSLWPPGTLLSAAASIRSPESASHTQECLQAPRTLLLTLHFFHPLHLRPGLSPGSPSFSSLPGCLFGSLPQAPRTALNTHRLETVLPYYVPMQGWLPTHPSVTQTISTSKHSQGLTATPPLSSFSSEALASTGPHDAVTWPFPRFP